MGQFPQFLTPTDFGMSTSATAISVITGKWNEVGRKTVGAQQILNWGVGTIANGVDSRRNGRLRLDSLAGQITGKFRLARTDANAEILEPILEDNTTNWSATNGIPVGFDGRGAKEDSALVILLNPDATTTVQYTDTDTTVNLPVTVTTGVR